MKNYAQVYGSKNDSIALEQSWYLKLETVRGELVGPTATDFLWTLGGGSIEFSQPFESSPHRSGRHHTNIIKKKKEQSFSFSTYFNIDETQVAPVSSEIDTPVRVLFKSLFGSEVTTSGAVYTTAAAPDLTFSLHEVGDKWARQGRGNFIQGGNMMFPGDGEATIEWTGAGSESYLVGIGKTTVDNEGGNTVELELGEGKRFPKGSLVMLVKTDGVTRSSDTASGIYRKVLSKSGDIVTLSGAPLADADGSVTPMYLVYAEPATRVGINNPVTGLVGSANIVGLGYDCFRSISINMQNNHELVNYQFGSDSLSGPIFVPGDRFTAEVSAELNLNEETLGFYNGIQNFDASDLLIVLGDVAGRHFECRVPNVRFSVPSFSAPDTGSIPITFTGNAYQTAIDAADEVTASFK